MHLRRLPLAASSGRRPVPLSRSAGGSVAGCPGRGNRSAGGRVQAKVGRANGRADVRSDRNDDQAAPAIPEALYGSAAADRPRQWAAPNKGPRANTGIDARETRPGKRAEGKMPKDEIPEYGDN